MLADLDRLYDVVKREKGKIDILFASAGMGEFAKIGERTYEHWVDCGKIADLPIIHQVGRDTAHYVRQGKAFVFVSILMLAPALVAQQPASQGNPPSSPSQATPSQQAPATPDATATAQVQQDIQQAWQSQSDLSKAQLNAQVSGGAITLTGTVANEEQHQKALRVATLHASGMKIVDKIKVQPQ